MTVRVFTSMILLKGVTMALILNVILTPSFVQSVATAVASACVSGVFLLFATHMNSKRTAKPVEDVRRTLEEKMPVEGRIASEEDC